MHDAVHRLWPNNNVRCHDKVYDQEVGLDFDVPSMVLAHVSWDVSPMVYADGIYCGLLRERAGPVSDLGRL